MPGSITVNYEAINQIVADIDRLAQQTQRLTLVRSPISTSKGSTAQAANNSFQLISEYAKTLAAVMRSTAQSITEAKVTMQETDEALAQQYNGT